MAPGSPISLAVIEGYLQCKYLGALRLGGRSESSDYLATLEERRRLVESALCTRVGHIARGIALTREQLVRGEDLIIGARLVSDGTSIEYPGLQRVRGGSALGGFHYTPILFCADQRPSRVERVVIEVLALLLEDVQGVLPRSGIAYCGAACKGRKVHFSAGLKTAKDLVRELWQMRGSEVQPRLVLNDHCPTCEYSAQFHEQAIREDNLSLLRGLRQKGIAAYARKGILTLTQLAHTFRPRRKGKRQTSENPKRYHALHAMAIRDRRVYVLGTPTIPESDGVAIYLDLEGVPDEDFVYLIGMIVCDGESQTPYSFWADGKD